MLQVFVRRLSLCPAGEGDSTGFIGLSVRRISHGVTADSKSIPDQAEKLRLNNVPLVRLIISRILIWRLNGAAICAGTASSDWQF